jgi:hypothetical protein
MGKQSERSSQRDYFKPLKNFRYNPYIHPYTASNKQTVLAQKLNKSYGIPLGNILRLIIYTDVALSLSDESELQLYHSDLKQIADFEKEHDAFEKLIFAGKRKTIEIKNPFLIERVFMSMINIIDSHSIIRRKGQQKDRTSSLVLKKVATELYNDLCTEEKFSPWRALCIIGYIFALYKVKLDDGEFILSEEEYDLKNKDRKPEYETYLQYLSSKIKPFVGE